MNTSLTLLIDEEVQRYLDYYIECFNIRIALFNPSGLPLRAGKQKKNCEFCRVFRSQSEFDKRCRNLDETMREKVLASGKTEFYRCHGGLWEALRAITVNGLLVGFAMVGQIRVDRKMNLKDKNHPLKKELEEIYSRTPLVDKEKLPAMIGLFDALVEFMVQKNFMKVRTDVFVGQLWDFIDGAMNRPVSLSHAASHMNMTPQALAHSIRRHGLEPFTVLVQKRKIARAKLALEGNSNLTIKELAYSLGFYDSYYFSRVFKKYTGIAPAHFRKVAGQVLKM